MSSLSVRIKLKERAKAVGMLEELLKRIVRGQVIVVSSGFWQEGTYDKYTFQFHVEIPDNSGKLETSE